MALIKEEIQPTGVLANYWSVSQFVDNRTNALVVLQLFLNEEAKKDKDYLPLKSIQIQLPEIKLEDIQAYENHIAYAYEQIKRPNPDSKGIEQNWFADAIDG